MSDLKPCPFCGASDAECSFYFGGFEGSYWEVVCRSCNACACGVTEDDAEAAWNRRVSNEKPAGEWDPNGTTPPPVELPVGMRWKRDLGCGWDVVCGSEWKGCVSNNWEGIYACWKGNRVIADCDTALEACRALADALKEES